VRLARTARRTAVAAAALVLTAGCGLTHVQDLSFRVDTRLHFVGLKDRAAVHLPLTIRWRMSDFTVAAPGSAPPSRRAGYFALFVDQSPIQPGQTLKAICKADPFERGDANCPTATYLEGRLVYPTTGDSVTLDSIPNVPGNKDHKQLHTFVVVLMDTAGRRIGESAWELDLRLPRIGA
jgi:hypothetical protein